MSSAAKAKPSGIPVPSSPATTSPTQRRRSFGRSANSKGVRVNFEDERRAEAKDEQKTEVEESPSQSVGQAQEDDSKDCFNEAQPEPTASGDKNVQPVKPLFPNLPVIKEDDDYQPFYVPEDDTYDEQVQDTYQFRDDEEEIREEEGEEEFDPDSPQHEDFSFTTPPTSPGNPPGKTPMVTSGGVNYDNEPSLPLRPYLLFNGTLIFLATLIDALVNSYPVTSFATLLFPALHLLLLGIVLSLVYYQTAGDPVTPGWKAFVQLGTVAQWLYFVLGCTKTSLGTTTREVTFPEVTDLTSLSAILDRLIWVRCKDLGGGIRREGWQREEQAFDKGTYCWRLWTGWSVLRRELV